MPRTNDTVDRHRITIPTGGSTQKLPIVLCLDVSPSMLHDARWSVQYNAVKCFLESLASNIRVLETAEIAFAAFADGVVYSTDFMPLDRMSFPENRKYQVDTNDSVIEHRMSTGTRKVVLKIPVFRPIRDAATDLPMSICKAHELLRDRLDILMSLGITHYASFLVVCTDGNPDSRDYTETESIEYQDELNKALNILKDRCSNNCPMVDLILPFFIGIKGSDANMGTLKKMAEDNLPAGLWSVDRNVADLNRLQQIFTVLANTITASVHYQKDTQSLLDYIAQSLKQI